VRADESQPGQLLSIFSQATSLLRKNWKYALRSSRSPSNTVDAMGIAVFLPSYDGGVCR
jgi:hypothetical protein